MGREAEGATREELAAGYAHPYRRYLPVVYRATHTNELVAAAAATATATGIVALVGAAPQLLVVLAVLAVVAAALRGALITGEAMAAVRRHTATWHTDPGSELDAVRRRRPHAGERDTRFVHDEYAVSVERGRLLTWCFVPLMATEDAVDGEVLVPGAPRYAASPVESVPYDARDTALAAEQLVEAQTAAAGWEADAAREAAVAWATREQARELSEESASTGAALRRLTGQDRR